MNYLHIAAALLAQNDVKPSPTNVGFELEIWKWVVVIAVVAFVIIFLLKRIGDIVTKKRTKSMIDSVVGEGESQKVTGWMDDDEEDEEEAEDEDEKK